MNKRQRGRNETTRIGSWESKQWREVARVGGTTQNKPHSYTLQGREGRIRKQRLRTERKRAGEQEE